MIFILGYSISMQEKKPFNKILFTSILYLTLEFIHNYKFIFVFVNTFVYKYVRVST